MIRPYLGDLINEHKPIVELNNNNNNNDNDNNNNNNNNIDAFIKMWSVLQKKSKFIEEHEGSGLLIGLGIKTSLIPVSLVVPMFF